MRKIFAAFLACSLVAFSGCALNTDNHCPDGECTPATDDQENVEQIQQALTYKTKTYYVSNPSSSANKFTRKSKALKVTATGSGLVGIDFMQSIYALNGANCNGKSSCSVINSFYSCTNHGTIPVTVTYTGSSAPSLKYWFTDCY